MWDIMEFFDALNLSSIHRDQNSLAYKLVVVASTIKPSKECLDGDGKLEINFRPSVPDNMKHWKFFVMMNIF